MKTNSLLQLLNNHKVVIPPIQRDYAQGRTTGKIPHVRGRFLDAMLSALTEDNARPMELDFVYGYIETDKSITTDLTVFKPLDGQQRLTTLFLIHWYIANKEQKMDEAKELLSKFSYATRHSSRSFCERLMGFTPDFNLASLDEQIINQPWFFSSWRSDPTIASMLVMLNEIDIKFGNLENVWDKLTSKSPRIVFHLLQMDDLGLPDDLYIKMNARGKGLSDFDHFKSQFSEILNEADAKIFKEKIDGEWSDLFWNVFKEKESDDLAKEVDNGFLSFFWYLTNILIAKNNIKLKKIFWLDTIKEVYNESPENIKFVFDSFSLFERLEKVQPGYFDELLYIKSEDFEVHKTRIFFNNSQTNLFVKCAETYGFGDKGNSFSVAEQLLLYAFIYMHLNIETLDNSKFRLLRNIFSSSEDQLRADYLSAFLYNDVEEIIKNQQYSANSKLSKRQWEEEGQKNNLVLEHPELKETIYRLEDHQLLRGNIALFDFDPTISQYADQFQKIFVPGCDYFEISKAMLTLGDYSQSYGKSKRFGNKNNSTWREIFTQSENRKGFENTKSILKSFLDLFIREPENTSLSVITNFESNHINNLHLPKDLLYYYIMYPSFIYWDGNQTEGFYWWDDHTQKPYECWMLFKKQFNGRHWNPFLLELRKQVSGCSIENFGSQLQYTNDQVIFLISNQKNGFKFSSPDGDEESLNLLNKLIENQLLNEEGALIIKQDENGLDIEDRIIRCKDFLSNLKFEASNS